MKLKPAILKDPASDVSSAPTLPAVIPGNRLVEHKTLVVVVAAAADVEAVITDVIVLRRPTQRTFSLQRGQFDPKFQVEGVARHQAFFL